MKNALEEKWKVVIPDSHAVLTWMMGYASFLLNRFEIGSDGKSSYERLKGKKAKVNGLEFCEGLWFKVKEKRERVGKLAVRWRDGVYLGIRAVSGEVIVGAESGVYRTRTVKRKPVESRWDQDNALRVGGVPWKVSDDDEGDGPAREGVIHIEAKAMDERVEQEVKSNPMVPRKFMIFKKDLDEHGYSEGCPGCKAILRGAARQVHSDACRKRLLSEMKDEPRVKEASKREFEFVTEVVEESERKRKKVREEKAATVEEAPVGQEASSSSGDQPRGSKRRTEVAGNDAEYDDEGTRINEVEKEVIGGKFFAVNAEEQDREQLQKAFDDVSGEDLDPQKVAESRREEIDFTQTRGIWEVVPTNLCWRLTGVGPTTVKWVDTRKRSRLVARDFKPKGEAERADVFASMPPWEAKKLLFSRAASQKGLVRKRKLLSSTPRKRM